MYFDSFCFKLLHYRSGPCQDKLRTSFLRAKGPQAVGHDNWEELTRWECDDVTAYRTVRATPPPAPRASGARPAQSRSGH